MLILPEKNGRCFAEDIFKINFLYVTLNIYKICIQAAMCQEQGMDMVLRYGQTDLHIYAEKKKDRQFHKFVSSRVAP